jgi:Leucine-rich repeat (LRR) protein
MDEPSIAPARRRALRQGNLPGALLSLLIGACGGEAGNEVAFASASWFGSCRTDADCRDGQCWCGVCTASCEATGCAAGPPGSACVDASQRAHQRFCAGRSAPALCLVTCESGECSAGQTCIESVCLPDAAAPGLLPPAPRGADAGASDGPLPALALCASDSVVWRSLALADQRGFDALAGCERVEGDLDISLSADADLRPLSALRSVTGVLSVHAPLAGDGATLPLPLRDALPGLEGLAHAGALLLSVPLTSLTTFAALRTIGTGRLGPQNRGWLSLQTQSLSDLRGLGLQEVDVLDVSGEPGLTSLEGLGSARVRAIILSETSVSNLGGLGAVSGIERLQLSANPLLQSLSGSTELAELRELELYGNARLTTLEGLQLPGEMRSISISNSEPLADITALARLTTIGQLRIASTSLTDLDALANLRSADTVSLGGNARLVQADALQGLTALLHLDVTNNDALQRLPVLPGVSELIDLTIQGNPLLDSGPGFPALTQAETVLISDNPRLTSVDGLAALRGVGNLTIARLEIWGNPALTAAQVTALRELPAPGGNLVSTPDAPALLDPCPFTGDQHCAETFGDCAPGTDRSGCGDLGGAD